ASGGAPGQVTRITSGFDYVIPAARIDIERPGAGGRAERTIEVAAGALAWDEATPGIYLRPAGTSAAERLRPIWLLPHGVILAGAKAPERVRLSESGGVKELTVALADGTEAKSRLDARNFITHVEFKVGAQTCS